MIIKGYRCYHSTGEVNNDWYRSVGLLNTGSRIVTAAYYNGQWGSHGGGNPYYAFSGFGTQEQEVTFYFDDGGYYSVQLKYCLNGAMKQLWN